MKKHYHFVIYAIILIVSLTTDKIYAQALQGPSDAASAAPVTQSEVSKIIIAGEAITMNGPQDENNKDFSAYNWYKIDASGNKQLTTVKTKKYTETTTAPGYYSYQLVTENANGCESPVSDVFKVYVLPVLDVTVTTANNSICTDIGSTSLAATTSLKNQKLVYQWFRNGVKIAGANTDTYNVTGEAKAAKIVFSVSASFALNQTAPVSATKEITVIPQASKPMITAN